MIPPTTKRRVLVEIGIDQHPVDYDVADSTETRARDIAVRDFIAEKIAYLDFELVEGDRNYTGWSRCTINISDAICIGDGCEEPLDYSYDTERETQLCYDCRNPALLRL